MDVLFLGQSNANFDDSEVSQSGRMDPSLEPSMGGGLDNHLMTTNNLNKHDEIASCDVISHAINPELALPTKHNSSSMTSSPNRITAASLSNSSTAAALNSPGGFDRAKLKKVQVFSDSMK